MHIRSNRQDKFSPLLYLLLLQFLSDKFSANQVFILHCFTGSFEISKAWLTQFPKTYFGFTFLVSSFAQTQINALKSVPKDRLLEETDAPYIAPNGIRVNSPAYLGEVIEVVARHRHDRLEDVSPDLHQCLCCLWTVKSIVFHRRLVNTGTDQRSCMLHVHDN